MKVRLFVVALLSALVVPAPAHAVSTVTVRFGMSAHTWAPGACPVTVDANADGLAVLDAAVAAHCLVSYTATPTQFGTFIACLDEVCGRPLTPDPTTGTYWNMYDGGVSASYGVDGFSATEGGELVFAYTAYCFGAGCPS